MSLFSAETPKVLSSLRATFAEVFFSFCHPETHTKLLQWSKGKRLLLELMVKLDVIHMVLGFQACKNQKLWSYGTFKLDFKLRPGKPHSVLLTVMGEDVRVKQNVKWRLYEAGAAKNVGNLLRRLKAKNRVSSTEKPCGLQLASNSAGMSKPWEFTCDHNLP